jgi:hypothetical protein
VSVASSLLSEDRFRFFFFLFFFSFLSFVLRRADLSPDDDRECRRLLSSRSFLSFLCRLRSVELSDSDFTARRPLLLSMRRLRLVDRLRCRPIYLTLRLKL